MKIFEMKSIEPTNSEVSGNPYKSIIVLRDIMQIIIAQSLLFSILSEDKFTIPGTQRLNKEKTKTYYWCN
jgi:hypothetical protein